MLLCTDTALTLFIRNEGVRQFGAPPHSLYKRAGSKEYAFINESANGIRVVVGTYHEYAILL